MIHNSIIIPVFGNEKLVHNLLESLRVTLDDRCEVIIVDDGHPDMKINPRALPYNVIYLSNAKNSGFSIAVNRGIDSASGKYISVINSDILVDENWLVETRKCCDQYSDLGMLGAKLIYPDYGRIMHAGTFFGRGFCFNGFRMSPADDDLVNQTIEVQALCDALATMPKKALLEVGKYSEEYFTSVEDLDMCMKLKQVGLRSIYNPKIIGYHKTAASQDQRYKQVTEDEKRFWSKWGADIEDETSEIFEMSLARGIESRDSMPKSAYVVNLNRKNSKHTLDSFVKLSGIKVISKFDYSDYVNNTPRYVQKSKIELLEVLPFSHLRLREPIVYIVDYITSIEDNFYWAKQRICQNDLVFDSGFNLHYLRDLALNN
jgi:GT2 family glycosyltransferase